MLTVVALGFIWLPNKVYAKSARAFVASKKKLQRRKKHYVFILIIAEPAKRLQQLSFGFDLCIR